MKILTRCLTAATCAAALVALAAPADAKARKRHFTNGEVIVVHPRAFTDSGNVVPVGSRELYVMQSTYYNMQPLARYSPGILWRPDPGNPRP